MHNERRRGQLGATMKYLRRTTSAAANNCLSSTIIPPLWCSGFCSKLRAPQRGTFLGPCVCGARACSLCSLIITSFLKCGLPISKIFQDISSILT
jgi:hypothetical protein